MLDITSIINGLDGELGINRSNSSNTDCFFQQTVLDLLFGKNDLSLTGCQFGECVRQSAIDDALNIHTASPTNGPGKELSGGVIAGLAVIGALILIAIVFLALGKIIQMRAKKHGPTHV